MTDIRKAAPIVAALLALWRCGLRSAVAQAAAANRRDCGTDRRYQRRRRRRCSGRRSQHRHEPAAADDERSSADATRCRSCRSGHSRSPSDRPRFEAATQSAVVRTGASVTAQFHARRRRRRRERAGGTARRRGGGPQAQGRADRLQLQNLPAADRRVRSLFLFTPATQVEPECGGFAISGQKGVYTNINGGRR